MRAWQVYGVWLIEYMVCCKAMHFVSNILTSVRSRAQLMLLLCEVCRLDNGGALVIERYLHIIGRCTESNCVLDAGGNSSIFIISNSGNLTLVALTLTGGYMVCDVAWYLFVMVHVG